MAVVVARVDPPSVIASRRRSMAVLRSPCTGPRRRHGLRGIAADAEISHGSGEPILEFGIEAVLGLTHLQVEETEHERAGKSEQRRRERDSDAPERSGEPFFERLEYGACVAGRLEAVDYAADRGHGLDQAPEPAHHPHQDNQATPLTRLL